MTNNGLLFSKKICYINKVAIEHCIFSEVRLNKPMANFDSYHTYMNRLNNSHILLVLEYIGLYAKIYYF